VERITGNGAEFIEGKEMSKKKSDNRIEFVHTEFNEADKVYGCCDCEGWAKGYGTLSQLLGFFAGVTGNNMDWPTMKYCPWCGKERKVFMKATMKCDVWVKGDEEERK